MTDMEPASHGIFALPNEILLSILHSFATPDLVQLSTTNRLFHSLVAKLLLQRLQIAAALDGYTLYLKCGPPAANRILQKVLCTALGTGGMQELSSDIEQGQRYVGILRQMGGLYSRFRPVTKEHDWLTRPRPRTAGDIPGSRTYVPAEAAATKSKDAENTVFGTVTIDADCLFSQLETMAFLGKREANPGLTCHIVCRGTIRVFREWLSKQCENKRWSDGEPVSTTHEAAPDTARSDSIAGPVDPHKDPSILWLNTGREEFGVKFRVVEQEWQRDQPILAASSYESPVSYRVELEEVLISTSRLLLNLEQAQHRESNSSGQALFFGLYY